MADNGNDVMKPREPGEDGSTQGQIQTPMCKDNVQNKKGGDTHSYKGTMNLNAAGNGNGGLKTDSKIEGPGANCNWDTQITIKGNNTGKRKY
jgi:hypothetical protein